MSSFDQRAVRRRDAFQSGKGYLLLVSVLAHPMMAYISLYSALYYHGMIDQIPSTIFAISNGKTKIFETPLVKISIHSIDTYFPPVCRVGKAEVPSVARKFTCPP